MRSIFLGAALLATSCVTGEYYPYIAPAEEAYYDAGFIEAGDEVMVPESSAICSKVGRVVAIRRELKSSKLFYKVKFAVISEGCYRYRIYSEDANLIKVVP